MADYKKMYLKLLNEMNDTIERFEMCLLEAENIYIDTANKADLGENNLTIFKKDGEEN